MKITSFKEALTAYQIHMKPTVVEHTLASYLLNLGAFVRFVEERERELINTRLIGEWVSKLSDDRKTSTIKVYLSQLSEFFKFCVAHSYAKSNPVDFELLPKLPPSAKSEKVIFTPDEYRRVLMDMKNRRDVEWSDFFIVTYHTGLRLSDCCYMRWDELVWTDEFIDIMPRKTKRFGKRVTIPMSPECFEVLYRRKNDPDERFSRSPEFVFPEFRLKYETDGHSNLSRCFRYRIERAGVAARGIHCARHTFVSRLANNDVNYGVISSMTGQTIDQIKTYHHVSLEAQRRAIAQAGAPNL